MGKGLQIAIAMLTVFGGLLWLSSYWSPDTGTFRYYTNVSEYLEGLTTDAGSSTRPSHVRGFIVPGSIERSLSEKHVDFAIRDKSRAGPQLSVRLLGIDLPDLFVDDAEVVIEGRFEQGRFLADRVMAKCPSKYESQEEA